MISDEETISLFCNFFFLLSLPGFSIPKDQRHVRNQKDQQRQLLGSGRGSNFNLFSILWLSSSISLNKKCFLEENSYTQGLCDKSSCLLSRNYASERISKPWPSWFLCLLERGGEASPRGATQGRRGAPAAGEGEERQGGQRDGAEGQKGQREGHSNRATEVGSRWSKFSGFHNTCEKFQVTFPLFPQWTFVWQEVPAAAGGCE